jgi:hypothetical protein
MMEASNVQKYNKNESGRKFRSRDEKGNPNTGDDEGYESKSKKTYWIRDTRGELSCY